MKKVAVIMGSDGDITKVEPAITMLKQLGVPCSVHVISAHRTPDRAANFARGARAAGYGVLIAAAGKAAHLAGVLAAYTTLPVIGIPVSQPQLDGLEALLATVQMPSGVPVATVAIDGSANAALLAAQMLGIEEPALAQRLEALKQEQADKVLRTSEALEAQFA